MISGCGGGGGGGGGITLSYKRDVPFINTAITRLAPHAPIVHIQTILTGAGVGFTGQTSEPFGEVCLPPPSLLSLVRRQAPAAARAISLLALNRARSIPNSRCLSAWVACSIRFSISSTLLRLLLSNIARCSKTVLLGPSVFRLLNGDESNSNEKENKFVQYLWSSAKHRDKIVPLRSRALKLTCVGYRLHVGPVFLLQLFRRYWHRERGFRYQRRLPSIPFEKRHSLGEWSLRGILHPRVHVLRLEHRRFTQHWTWGLDQSLWRTVETSSRWQSRAASGIRTFGHSFSSAGTFTVTFRRVGRAPRQMVLRSFDFRGFNGLAGRHLPLFASLPSLGRQVTCSRVRFLGTMLIVIHKARIAFRAAEALGLLQISVLAIQIYM